MPRKPIVSPEAKMWSILDMLKSRYRLTDYDFAEKAKVSDRTVRRDRICPEKIPLERLLRYFSIFMTESQFVSMIESSIAGKSEEEKL